MKAVQNTSTTANNTAPWRGLATRAVVRKLSTDPKRGLDAAEATRRLFGPSRLPEGKKGGPFTRFLAQVNNIGQKATSQPP